MLNMNSSSLSSCVRETLQRTEEIQLLYWRCRTSSPCPSVTMTNRGDDCYFFYYSTCTKVSRLSLVWHIAVDTESHRVSCFCRVTAAPSDTARQQSAARPSAPSGRRGAASATPASFDTWRSRYEKEYIFHASAIMEENVALVCVRVFVCAHVHVCPTHLSRYVQSLEKELGLPIKCYCSCSHVEPFMHLLPFWEQTLNSASQHLMN